jgi:IS5 family transposase
MDSFRSYMLREAYRNLEKLGDRLAKPDKRIDWEKFRPITKGMYRNDTERGGRPNLDEVTMVKLLVIQQWYTLSDPELERQVADRLSFQRFLGFPEQPPDYSTVWKFRERLEETGKIREIWGELQRQLDEKGLKVKKGVIQDAAIMDADPRPLE